VKSVDLADSTLRNGLRVLAVRHGSGPLVELRLHIPAPALNARRLAEQSLLAGCLTGRRTRVRAGSATPDGAAADFAAWADYRRIGMSASLACGGLDVGLRLFADATMGLSLTREELVSEREQLLTRLRMALAHHDVPVRLALLRQLFGDHPYTLQVPDLELMSATEVTDLDHLAQDTLRPDRSTLVVVGPGAPEDSLRAVESALGDWSSGGPHPAMPTLPAIPEGELRLLPTPGAVRSRIRLRAPGIPQYHPSYPALMVATNLIGSGTSSRLSQRLREELGYVYGVSCYFEPVPGGTLLAVEADTATDTVAPAVLVLAEELHRLQAHPPTPDEVDAARRHAAGAAVTTLTARAAMASSLAELAAADVEPLWLFEVDGLLRTVTDAAVSEASTEFFAPHRFSGVVAADLPAEAQFTLADPASSIVGI
jgi:predicted Zn-dependent peptidase